MKKVLLLLCLVQMAIISPKAQVQCSDYNSESSHSNWVVNSRDGFEHPSYPIGEHYILANGWYTCMYQGPHQYYGRQVCTPTAKSWGNANTYEYPSGSEPVRGDKQPGVHRIGNNYATESAVAVGDDEPSVRFAVAESGESCAKSDSNCTYTGISFNQKSFIPTYTYHRGTTGYDISGANVYWGPGFWDDATCPFETLSSGHYSPIVIDLAGDNFQTNFTSASAGINWDFYGRGDGTTVQLSWTQSGAQVGFLWLDRSSGARFMPCYLGETLTGCDGVPTSGKELFGNITPQRPPAGLVTTTAAPYTPSGFGALAVLDSNHDGVIDTNDLVYNQLRVWVDLNHNGLLDNGENFTLQQLGITSISVAFSENGATDQYGNVRWLDGSLTGKPYAIYDVLFVGPN